MIGQRKPRSNAPYKWFKLPQGRNSLSLSWPTCACSHALFFLLMNTWLVSLLSVSLREFSSTKSMGQGACHWPLVPGGLMARIQCSHCHGLTSVSGREPKSCFKPLQAKTSWDQLPLTFQGSEEVTSRISGPWDTREGSQGWAWLWEQRICGK